MGGYRLEHRWIGVAIVGRANAIELGPLFQIFREKNTAKRYRPIAFIDKMTAYQACRWF